MSRGEATGRFKAGDWVQVKVWEEIVKTLDADGTLDGLPFMPEMAAFCGQRVRLAKQAWKTCLECPRPEPSSAGFPLIMMREFIGEPVWTVEGLRCDGSAHDGCQRGCLYFWKSAWFTKVQVEDSTGRSEAIEANQFGQRLKTKQGSDCYFCQSTELIHATKAMGTKRRLRVCLGEVISGNVGLLKMVGMVVQPIFWKLVERFIRPRFVQGSLEKTPLITLALQPGTTVEVRSVEEIRQTLNRNGCNRGLRYDIGLNRLCGTHHRVRDRLDKMIIESTGKMVRLQGTVTLEDSTCTCELSAVGGCVRQDLVYWREAWLKPAETGGTTSPR